MLPNNIARLRKANKLSQTELAKLIGTELTMMGKLERGERDITSHWIEQISAALKVEPYRLFAPDHLLGIGGEAGAPPPVWIPRETTMMRFLAAARRALPNDLDPKDEIETVAHALVVGLKRLANQPSIEDDPLLMDAAVDAVAGAARRPPSSHEQAA